MRVQSHTLLTITAIVLFLSTLFVWNASATSSRPPAQATAIGTVDIMVVLEGLNERDVLQAQLDERTKLRQAQLDEVLKDLGTLEEDMKLLNPGTDEYRQKLQEGIEKQPLAKTRREVLMQIVSIDNGTVMSELFSEIESAIQNIAQREGYDIVLFDDTSFEVPTDVPNPDVVRAIITKSIIYRHDSIDITQQVITLMNNEFGAP